MEHTSLSKKYEEADIVKSHYPKIFFLILFVLVANCNLAHGNTQQPNSALNGLKTVKVYFDVTAGEPQRLLLRLSLIDKSLAEFKVNNITPEAVIGFRGKASRFVTKGFDYIDDEEREAKVAVQQWLERYHADNIALEQCRIAAQLVDIAEEDIRSELKIVGNAYVSMIAYQNRGFALVPMD